MRELNHTLTKSISGKSVALKVSVDDRYGEHNVVFSTLYGWRMKLAIKHLSVDSKEWDDDVARKFVGMKILSGSRDEYEAMQFLHIVKEHGVSEVHFWASKFLTNPKAVAAWRTLYSQQKTHTTLEKDPDRKSLH